MYLHMLSKLASQGQIISSFTVRKTEAQKTTNFSMVTKLKIEPGTQTLEYLTQEH